MSFWSSLLSENLPPNTFFGLDCSMSARRNAKHAINVFIDPAFQPVFKTGQLIEYLDLGHLKKGLGNIFDLHNSNNHLYKLKEYITARFNYIVRRKDISIEEKVAEWQLTPDWVMKNCKNKGYLDSEKKRKRRISPDEAKNTLKEFLKESERLIRKCGVANTQAIESFNSIKANFGPQQFTFQISFKIRCLMTILKWNEDNCYHIIDDLISNFFK
ncbi:hypothetical protein M9Y10_042239 [Tritrichomonas musculus]|uniref:Uncharacterized protein n=1 Tax=Tritrichomonas musculus TaxID=1915356 RepID=A0ABR2K6K7_9EUKA